MRRRVLLAAGVMVVALLLAAVTASAPFSAAISGMPADIPATGDTWKYNVTSSGTTGNATLNVTGTADIKAGVNETEEYHCYNYTTIMETISSTINMTVIVHTYYSMDGNVTAMHVHIETKTPTATGIMEGWYHFNDTWKMFDFPLEKGKTWSKNLSAYFIGWTNSSGTNVTYDWNNATSINYTVTGEVINVTEVNTGAGTFECWLVNLTNPVPSVGSYSLMWYNPEVKNVVYREDYTGATLTTTWNLTSYSVSYPIHEMIQTLTLFTLWNMQQQQQQTNMMIMAGVGVAVAAVVVGVAVYYLRRR
nr:hypothetical protein [Candidatus Bathyarchaeota archaeon]